MQLFTDYKELHTDRLPVGVTIMAVIASWLVVVGACDVVSVAYHQIMAWVG